MGYADDVLRKNIEQVLWTGEWDMDQEVRPKWADGSPAYTQYVTSVVNTYDLAQGQFPLTTLRPVAWKSALKEILWIYQDRSNDVNLLKEKYNVHYWDSWKNKEGNLGTAYGYQINKKIKFPEGEFNQIERVIHLLKNDPQNRRIMTNMIDMEEMKDMTLVPCAFMTMWTVRKGKLDMTLIQRSNDLVAAQSINATQYAMLLMMVASVTGYEPGKFTHFIQNMHIYNRHINIAREMLSRKPTGNPIIKMKPEKEFKNFTVENFWVEDYNPNPQIKNIPIAI